MHATIPWFQVAASTFIIIATAFVCAAGGLQTVAWLLPSPARTPRPARLGIGFFVGVCILLAVFRSAAQLAGSARVGLFVAVLVLVILTAMCITKKTHVDVLRILTWRRIAVLIPVVLAISAICFFLWLLKPSVLMRRPELDCIGSLHSGRYVGIANYVVGENRIPVLGQNYGQSLLSAVPQFLGLKTPYWNLYVWLMLGKFFLALLVYGLSKALVPERTVAVFGTVGVMLGNTALSLSRVNVVDSVTPFLFNGYTDSILSVGAMLVFLWCLSEVYTSESMPLVRGGFLTALCAVAACMSAPQNVILMAVVLGSVLIHDCVWRRERLVRGAALMVVLVGATMLGRKQGGMFAPKACVYENDAAIPGMISLAKEQKLRVVPYLWCGVGFGDCAPLGVPCHAEIAAYEALLTSEGVAMNPARTHLFWYIEDFAFQALRVMLYPMAGFVLALWAWRVTRARRGKVPKGDSDNPQMRELALCGGLVFLCGGAVSYLFAVGGYKWELTRFLMPGIALGLMALPAALYHLLRHLARKAVWWVLSVTMCLLVFGPTWSMGLGLVKILVWDRSESSVEWRIKRVLAKTDAPMSRDTAIAHASRLVQQAVQTSLQVLAAEGSIRPFALVATRGTAAIVSFPGNPVAATVTPELQRQAIEDELRRRGASGAYIAVAVASHERIVNKPEATTGDAIRVSVEGEDIDAIECIVPFATAGGRITVGAVDNQLRKQNLLPK